MQQHDTDVMQAPTPSTRRALRGRPLATAVPSHVVQFYQDDAFLCAAVAEFLAEGVAMGQPIAIIATEPHRRAIATALRARGVDVGDVHHPRIGVWADARETLSSFMTGSVVDPERFRLCVSELLDRCRGASGQLVSRVYGEMVDVLWKDGNIDGAVELEARWNDLAQTQSFTLLCAYAMANFADASHTAGFADICRHHAHVIPAEDYMQADDDARLREISRLQQQAQVLQAEIVRRETIERKLAEALDRERAVRAEAEAAVRAKSEFLAVMSHELRTPLNAIGGYVQLVELGVHGPLTEAQREALARVQRSQRHLLSLINQVLNLARIEQGHLEYAIERVALDAVLTEVRAIVEPLLLSKHLTCAVRCSTEHGGAPLAVRADREKLRQIMLNLLSNAIKFTADGGRIVIEAKAADAPALVSIGVRDTGIGIPVDQLEAVFSPFVQLLPGDDARQEGAGLGLAISRNLARGMDGDLTAESSVGAGATFVLTLPLA